LTESQKARAWDALKDAAAKAATHGDTFNTREGARTVLKLMNEAEIQIETVDSPQVKPGAQ
jgi:hypothetical protein